MNNQKYIDDHNKFNDYFLLLEDIPLIINKETEILIDKLVYIIYGISILPIDNKRLYVLEQLSKLYYDIKDTKGNWYFKSDIEKTIISIYFEIKMILPLKVNIIKAGKILRCQLKNNSFRCGIELGIISEIMDLKNTPYLNEDLPSYSRIGLGYHSSRAVNEEQQILSDAFFLLIMADDQYNKMYKYKNNLPDIKIELHSDNLTGLNSNVCAYCRNSIISFFAFFEALVNGICLNFLYYNHDLLNSVDINTLQGKDQQGNKYLTLSLKLERMQSIIAKKITYTTNNPQQLKDETIKTVLSKIQEKRDIAMHYSKVKGEIMFSPQEWMIDANDSSKLIIEASRKIWKACYINSEHYPYYLSELNYEYLIEKAKKRNLVID